MPLKRPAAIDFWEEPAYYNGPRESDEVQEVQAEEAQPVRRPEVAPRSRAQENQAVESSSGLNPTCVTPFVAGLSEPYYRNLVVVGPPTRGIDTITQRMLVRMPLYIEYMSRLLEIVHAPPSRIEYNSRDKLGSRSRSVLFETYRAVVINTLRYEIGDIVIIPIGQDGRHAAPEFPTNSNAKSPVFAGDLFWFAKILAIKRDTEVAHVQWFEHGCKTILEELAHPQELYLTSLCDDIPLAAVLARCQCCKLTPGERPVTLVHEEFFYSVSYDRGSAVFRDISELETSPTWDSSRAGACDLCRADQAEFERASTNCTRIIDDGDFIGFELQGLNYHCWDVALIQTENGQCEIGQITSIAEIISTHDEGSFSLTIKLFGRVNDLIRQSNDMNARINEDRHLFLTEEELQFSSADVLGKCYVLQKDSVRNLRVWLTASPLHFYVTQCAPSVNRASTETLLPLHTSNFFLCGACMGPEVRETEALLEWKARRTPLRIFDPFAGVGAFPLGLSQAGKMKLTHAIEIDPSAAKTLKKNSYETIVYNQCANKMLEYSILRANGSHMTLESLVDEGKLPPPPRREDIDCIVSGFPCQPHSSLNMFQKADDLQNELVLNTIAWVDHLRPKYCLFENVEGFADHRIMATQRNRYAVEGGIEKGGIKYLVRALTALGYQVRFGLLQAAHYGAPQSRVRFFLWGAQAGRGCTLPEFPACTHHFPRARSLGITFPNGEVVAPIDSNSIAAPLPFVSVRDAISDLKRWDWANPHKIYKETRDQREQSEIRDVLQVTSHYGDDRCGLVGEIPYEHAPRSGFQARCRRRPATDIQHVTPCLKDELIESVANIPLEEGANYKSLNNKPKLWAWQVMNASSANARSGYRAAMYSRLEADGYFNTTVTNVGVTAKQSKVLNPWCKRMVTVRELARSQGFPDDFQFYALDDRVRTMHKQIGNAVPWPLGEALGRELEKAVYKGDRRKEME
ncbi:S-adenosyl-L-methionine-dependent methyltransferase [Phellopilus nigrolimitatus]|nr:S-adenosyl-L-methionine-dependent methyltransferase [Phellopilus nigrolimitatus]